MSSRPAGDSGALAGGREDALKVVTEVFAVKGYAATSAEQLRQAFEVNGDDFDRLFEGKEDCFSQAHGRALDLGVAQVQVAYESSPVWTEQIAAALAEVVDLVEGHPAEARIVLVEAFTATRASASRDCGVRKSAARCLGAGRALTPDRERLPRDLESMLINGVSFMFRCALRRGEHVRPLFGEALRLLLMSYLDDLELARFLAQLPVDLSTGPNRSEQ